MVAQPTLQGEHGTVLPDDATGCTVEVEWAAESVGVPQANTTVPPEWRTMATKLNLDFAHLDGLFECRPNEKEIHLRLLDGAPQSHLNIQQLYNWQTEKWAMPQFMSYSVPFMPGGFMGLQPVATIQEGWKVLIPAVPSFAIYGLVLTQGSGESPYVVDDTTNISITPHARPHLKLFLSHSSADKDLVRQLNNRLLTIYDLFFDETDIRPGESIPVKVSEGIETSDYLVLVASATALASDWVQSEWAAMRHRGKPIVPILLEDVTLPALLAHIKYIRFTGDLDHVVNELANATGSGTP